MSVVRTGNANAWQRGCSRLLFGILRSQAIMPVVTDASRNEVGAMVDFTGGLA